VGLKDTTVMAPYFAEYVKARLVDTYGADVVYRGGISVKTTLDMGMQRIAEKAVAETLNREGDPSAALVAIDPNTGEILAMVGGRDFSTQQFNVAVQGKRQPGSAFKPFVLLSALEQGVSSEAVYPSGPASFNIGNGQTWKVTGSKTSSMRLRQATEKSVNSVFAKLILDTKPDKTVEMAERIGIHEGIDPVPAIALGGLEQGVSPLEMASAYGTLAAKGKHVVPYGIAAVLGDEGEVIHSAETSVTQPISPALAYVATDMLRGVITKGTGSSAAIGRPAAGKTGTTQEYRDAWFVGYTPQLVCAVWVGYPEEQREMKNVHGVAVTGGTFPAKIWSKFMKGALAKAPVLEFQKPKGVTTASLCSETGLTATEYCPTKVTGLLVTTKLPESCTKHAEPVKITIPKLVGMSKDAAIAALQKLMLLFKVVEADVPGVGAGIVAKQDPVAGSQGTTQTVVTITVSNGGSADLPPKADFKFSPSQVTAGSPVEFDGSHAKDNGTIVKFYWEFGDGTEAEGVKQQHIFTSPGTFEVTLWVTDDKNQTASVTKEIVVD
ncbi:MAG: penicillin-binding transpeptidase domain-containing protein, partial [Coriobacteriia bacterium]